ncbi:MAG: enoyl-CoA hydratase [Alphaproteobacteria bacterium]|nr:MAG: enoyl-CoA hydratase [Alphaproteobacteria bacterium]
MPVKYKCFEVEKKHGIAHLQMSRPEKANSMNSDFWMELPTIIRELDAAGDVRVCILSGQGKNFSGGMDLSFFAQPVFANLGEARKREFVTNIIKGLQNAFDAFDNARFPIIAAVQGSCIGGALDMIAACDLRYCSSDARFSIEEINIGMMADLGSLQRLPLIMPEAVVREISYTGDLLDAVRAQELNLVNNVYASHVEMMDAVQVIAEKIASKPPMAISSSKKAFNHSRNHGLVDSLAHVQLLQAAFFEPKDVMIAMQARVNKEVAEFEDVYPLEI